LPAQVPLGERGLTVTECLVGIAIAAVVAGTVALLLGAAVRSKMIGSTRSAETETAQSALGWMVERLRNAGLDLQPSAQLQARCKDRLVAQDAQLLPTAHSVYASGEMVKTSTVAGDEVLTIGYYVALDPDTSHGVVMEYRQPCASGATSVPEYSARLSNPKLNVTDLSFQYFDAGGAAITSLIGPIQIRKIAAIKISLTVQGSEGASGVQTQTLARSVVFWNPEPNVNNWINANENY
jgi:hypothetical protein